MAVARGANTAPVMVEPAIQPDELQRRRAIQRLYAAHCAAEHLDFPIFSIINEAGQAQNAGPRILPAAVFQRMLAATYSLEYRNRKNEQREFQITINQQGVISFSHFDRTCAGEQVRQIMRLCASTFGLNCLVMDLPMTTKDKGLNYDALFGYLRIAQEEKIEIRFSEHVEKLLTKAANHSSTAHAVREVRRLQQLAVTLPMPEPVAEDAEEAEQPPGPGPRP